MKKLFGFITIAFFTASIANANPMFKEYIDWIVANSNLQYNNELLPKVEYMDQAILQIMAYGDTAVAQSEYKNKPLPKVLGIYDNNTIFLSNKTNINNFANHHIIVHELVHYLQDINNITDTCIGRLEVPAYKLQKKWQDEVNHPAPRPDELFIVMLTRPCGADWHY